MFVNLFIGISPWSNVLARLFAAKKEREMSGNVHTAIAFALVSGIGMAFDWFRFAGNALELMGTPDDVISYQLYI